MKKNYYSIKFSLLLMICLILFTSIDSVAVEYNVKASSSIYPIPYGCSGTAMNKTTFPNANYSSIRISFYRNGVFVNENQSKKYNTNNHSSNFNVSASSQNANWKMVSNHYMEWPGWNDWDALTKYGTY